MNNLVEESGFASLDKPHQKYYRKNPMIDFDVNQTMIDLVRRNNRDYLKNNASSFFNNKITYDRLLNYYVEKAISAYLDMGVRNGDTVGLCMINTHEVLINLLALNAIGAVSQWIDLRVKEENLIKYINEGKCKVLVSFSEYAQLIEKIIGETNLQNVIVVYPEDSLSPIQRVGKSLMDKKAGKKPITFTDERFISFKDFIKKGTIIKNRILRAYDKEKPVTIVQSSGTTGKPKSIVHTDFSCNQSMLKLGYSDLPFFRGNKVLNVIPPFIGLGLYTAIYGSLVYGMEVILEPEIGDDTVLRHYGEFDFSYAAPLHYRYLYENIDKVDFTKHKPQLFIAGGSKFEAVENARIQSTFNITTINGYGNNEVLGPVTVNPIFANRPGSVGIPLYGNDIIVWDREKECEKKYYELGELCFKTETMFTEYLNNENETARVKKLHDNGEYYIHSGDLGYIDKDGFVYVVGRLERSIERHGFKISPFNMETVINKLEFVKECITVGVKDKIDGQVPMSFIELHEEYKNNHDFLIEEIKKACEKALKENEVPKYYQIIDKIPYTPNNKPDHRGLEKIGNEIVEKLNENQNTLERKIN